MFEQARKLSHRMADAVDLAIDFATLGEYGLEPVAEPQPPECRAGRRRETRLPGSSRGAVGLAGARR
jgi:hypothetical protein